MLMDTQEAREGIVKDFSARCQEILGLAMEWAPNATLAHLQEYAHRHSSLPHHAGLALLTESVLENACLNVHSAPLGKQTLDKRPSCVKRDTPRFITVLGLRNFYSGEVAGMIRALKSSNPLASTKELQDKSGQQLMEEMRVASLAEDNEAHRHLLWRMTSLVIMAEGNCRSLLNLVACSHLELFTAETVQSAVECWQWLISARPDLEFCFLQEMAAAWQFAFEKRMGIFAADKETINPLATYEGVVLQPQPPLVQPHDIWIRFLIERIEIAKYCSQDQVSILLFIIY